MDAVKTEVSRKISSEFTEIPLEDKTNKSKKFPKRRVYFSDGYLDEYSTDDDADCGTQENQPLIDPKTLTWLPYLWYLTWWIGGKALAVCDYLGEHIAYILGITSPKFQYELDQYKRLMEEEEALKKKISEDNAGWNANLSTSTLDPIEMKPLPTKVTLTSEAMPSIAKESSNKTADKLDSQHWDKY